MKFDVAGGWCKKTIVNENGMEANGMILYATLSNSWPNEMRPCYDDKIT